MGIFGRMWRSPVVRDVGLLAAGAAAGYVAGRDLASKQATTASAQAATPSPTTASAPSSGPLDLAQVLQALRAPDALLEVMLAAEEAGYVASYYERHVRSVPAGTTQTFTDSTPADTVAFTVGYRAAMDPATATATATVSTDSLAPFATAVPLQGDWSLRGPFLAPIHFQIVYQVAGDPDDDGDFASDLQAALVNVDYARSVLRPWFQRQFAAIAGAVGVQY